MQKTVVLMVLAGLMAASGEARAQTGASSARTFLDINGGVQGLSPALDAGGSFLLFGETGSVRTSQNLSAGLLGDVRLGHRIGQRFAVAVAIAGFTTKSPGLGIVSEPSPILVASPTVVSLQADFTRREIGYHPEVAWFVPWSRAVNMSIVVGPSFVHVQQNVMTATVSSAQVVSVGPSNESGMALGAHAGVDISHSLSRRWGVGLIARYVFASVDLQSASGVKAGGLQLGAGFRLKF
jgi:hypothetical protein